MTTITKYVSVFAVPALVGVLFFSSAVASAQVFDSIIGSLESIYEIVNIGTSIVVSLAFLYFFYNLAMYIFKEEGKEASKTKMGYSIIAIVVLTSLWGIVVFVRAVVGIDTGEANQVVVPTATFLNG